MPKNTLDVGGEPNPYLKELLEILAIKNSDADTAMRLRVSLRARIEDDIERERRELHSRLPDLLVAHRDGQILKPLQGFVEKYFDIPARLYLFSLADRENPHDYFEVLEYLKKREAPIWEVLARALEPDLVRIILDGRVSFWKAKGMSQARRVKDERFSVAYLMAEFMKKKGIPGIDGPHGLAVRFPALGRDTLMSIRDETRWVKEETYRKLADFIGCLPEQLYPRNLPRPQTRARKTTTP